MTEKRKYLIVHITATWYWYLLACVLVIALWAFVFGMLDRIPYHEQLNIFIGAYEIQEEQMEEQIFEMVKNSGIRQVTVDPCTPGREETFHMVMATRGTVNTDMLILPDGTWPESLLQGKVLGFSEEDVVSFLPEGEYKYLKQNDRIYGICVYDAETGKTSLQDGWISFEADVDNRDYYLFVSAEADNVEALGTLFQKAEEVQK